ncbi:MAG: Vi polysaccharide biosynthesis UDP-N-acetylglucosamine C-6 dehydrogenase TviB [Rhodobacteraceae bacterium]|nr:Vi polysaccharide biosynthesis UDP-N-acetylglucosamine C-6 dehydrogenase TviB [Paracoccaceae bacterium]
MFDQKSIKIAVIGLGYVGLPLAVEFGKQRSVVGFDLNPLRIDELKARQDKTGEVSPQELGAAQLTFTTDPAAIADCNVYIVTVPTPIDQYNKPDLRPLLTASETVGKLLKPGDIVVYESTVYPGATEDDCVPILEQQSGLTLNTDFYVGYSPERINPGDTQHRLPDIKKVTSGSTPDVAEQIDALYREIITAGTYKAPSIRVAEAAKVIENAQRDLNIAFMNELAIIFDKMGIDTNDVLKAAATKWNFLAFQPGLVGGHCIGVDPYYLTHKAQDLGYNPEIILAGRRMNDGMGAYVAGKLVKAMLKKGIQVNGAKVLILGLTFKENCPDLRNTKVVDVINELQEYGATIDVHDPRADADEAEKLYGLKLVRDPQPGQYDGVLLAVPHQEFKQENPAVLRRLGKQNSVFMDLKGIFDKQDSDSRL